MRARRNDCENWREKVNAANSLFGGRDQGHGVEGFAVFAPSKGHPS